MSSCKVKSRVPSCVASTSIDEVLDALEKIAQIMGFVFVNNEDYVYFAVESIGDTPPRPASCIYGKAGVPRLGSPYDNLLKDCMQHRKTFGRSISNPFYECRSLEEVYIRADLVDKQ